MPASDREILAPLVSRVAELAVRPGEAGKQKLWADHQALRRAPKVPVCVYYEGIPEPQWRIILGEPLTRCASPLAASLELDLRKRIWMAEHVPDDHIVWPHVTVGAVVSRSVGWGVTFSMEGSAHAGTDDLEARRFVPAFADSIDAAKVRFTDLQIDREATERRRAEAAALTGGILDVHVHYPDLSHAPFDTAVRMRGLEAILMDAIDAPEKVQELMEAITSGYERHHQGRESSGLLNIVASRDGRYVAVGFRVHCAYARAGASPAHPTLADEWAYISAQTSSGLGPGQFALLVHPYNSRLARAFTNNTVYFHGCERLDEKLEVLATLPYLRRFHVSPWSSVRAAVSRFRGSVVLEVHAHPGKVFFGSTREDMREEIEGLLAEAEGHPMDLNLSDIHSVGGDPGLLTAWAEEAQAAVGA